MSVAKEILEQELARKRRLGNVMAWKSVDVQFLESYRSLLAGQYQTLSFTTANAGAKDEAEAILRLPLNALEWDHLYRLELAIVKLEPEPMLRRRAWVLRNEYEEISSPQESKDYLTSKPPNSDTGDVDLLRADLVRLQEELNWRYVVLWVLESIRTKMVRSLLAVNLPIVFVLFLLAQLDPVANWVNDFVSVNLPLLAAIVMFGVLGGLVSTLRRVQAATFGKNADLDLSELSRSNISVYLSPIFGGIFALLLFFLFAGSLISGSLFPNVSVETLFMYPPVEESGELAKIIVYSFIAGFAEKFVPDNLERLTKAESSDSAST